MSLTKVGASFVLVMVIVNVSDTLSKLLSVAVIITSIAPTSPLSGVPEKVLVAASKLSQEGRLAPLDREAV